MVEIPENMIGIEAASAQLAELEAAEAAAVQAQAGKHAQHQAEQSASAALAQQGDRASQSQGKQPKTPDSLSPETGTPAADAASAAANKEQQTKEQTQQTPKEPSRYEKARGRQENAWKQINDEKAALKADRERLEASQRAFEEQRKTEEARFTPDQYDKAAEKFEKEGKFDLADLARQRASELRKNPPPSPQQREVMAAQAAQHQAQMKEWWGKAAIDFPSVAKEGSTENQALAGFIKAEPDVLRSPKGMYYAARLVTAEQSAARVPAMEKELGALRARVKELEALTAPGGGGVAQNPNPKAAPKSDAEEYAELEALAMGMGTLR